MANTPKYTVRIKILLKIGVLDLLSVRKFIYPANFLGMGQLFDRLGQCIFWLLWIFVQSDWFFDPLDFNNLKNKDMLRWTVTFVILAIIAAIFGFGGIAEGAADIARILFFIFLVFVVISFITGRRKV
jgi:uncharacterized membrane protein YtjA (UPF0391 family)